MSQSQANTSQTKVSEDTILKIAKEVAIKFIEVGRISPATFEESFTSIHKTIKKSVESK